LLKFSPCFLYFPANSVNRLIKFSGNRSKNNLQFSHHNRPNLAFSSSKSALAFAGSIFGARGLESNLSILGKRFALLNAAVSQARRLSSSCFVRCFSSTSIISSAGVSSINRLSGILYAPEMRTSSSYQSIILAPLCSNFFDHPNSTATLQRFFQLTLLYRQPYRLARQHVQG